MPRNVGGAFAFPSYTAVVAALGKVEGVSLRTIDEALGIPSEESHVQTYEAANWLCNVIRGQHIDFQVKEIRAILDRLLEIGEGDIIVGCIKGVEAGIIDSSFSPNKQVKDLVVAVKDSTGAIRYKDFGNLPLPEEVKEFHREKLAQREKSEGRKMDYEVYVQDFWAFSRGQLIGKP
jgi:methylaspartate mutase epsilon subunit